MDGFMSTAEAAAALRVNRQRVVQLINAGKLDAAKVGRSYIVAADSVERRKRENPGPGNPNFRACRTVPENVNQPVEKSGLRFRF